MPSETDTTASAPEKPSRKRDWKAYILQLLLFLASFAVISVGLVLESDTPSGFTNGFWAVSIVIPSAGFMLSLANWCFLRFYKSRKAFSTCSLLVTLVSVICAYIWAGFHYELSVFDFAEILRGISFTDFFELAAALSLFFGIGFILSAVFCVLSKVLSNKYAEMLGKE